MFLCIQSLHFSNNNQNVVFARFPGLHIRLESVIFSNQGTYRLLSQKELGKAREKRKDPESEKVEGKTRKKFKGY